MNEMSKVEGETDGSLWASTVEYPNVASYNNNTNVQIHSNQSMCNVDANHPRYDFEGKSENDIKIERSKEDESTARPVSNVMSIRQKRILGICSIALLMTRLAYSILGPFYPTEAEKKGMDTTMVGLVFGVFELIIALSSPIFGNYLIQLGVRRMLLVGFTLGGVCNIAFGTLDYAPNGAAFILASIICRSVEALGYSAFVTSCYAIISSEFANNIGVAFGILVSISALGFVVGPLLGGILYEVGGFGLPFYLMGAVTLAYGAIVYKFLPVTENVQATRPERSFFHLLRNPMVAIPMCSLVIGSVGVTNFMATFAEHIQEPFHLSAAIVGVVFMIPPLMFSLISPLWGYLADKKNLHGSILSVGHIVFAVGFFLIGPKVLVPFVPFKLWSVCFGLVLIGMSAGCFFTPVMKCMVTGAMELDFEDNTDTYAMVSGLFNSMDCLGGMIGPIGVGALVDAFGHHMAYTSVAVLSLFMAIVCCAFFSILYCTKSTSQQYTVNEDRKGGVNNIAFAGSPISK